MAAVPEGLKVSSIPQEEVLNTVLGCFLGAYLGFGSSKMATTLEQDPTQIMLPIFLVLVFVFAARDVAKDIAAWRWKNSIESFLWPVVIIGILIYTRIEGFMISQSIWAVLIVWLSGYIFLGGLEAIRRAGLRLHEKNVADGIYDSKKSDKVS